MQSITLGFTDRSDPFKRDKFKRNRISTNAPDYQRINSYPNPSLEHELKRTWGIAGHLTLPSRKTLLSSLKLFT